MMKKILMLISVLFMQQMYAQEPNDCVNAITVCGNGTFSSNAEGIGEEQEVSGCGGFEHNSIWIKIDIVQSGTLGFDLIPEDTALAVDYDFWVYPANADCSNLGSPIRCATTNPVEANLSNNHTGINGSTTATQSGPGASGTGYVYWLNVTAGQSYYIAIDRPEGDGGFSIDWTGTAMDGDGAFPDTPEANQIEDLKTCSTSGNVGIFDLNSVADDINSANDATVSFYGNLADATDGVNALSGIMANSSNPQEIYAKVVNDISGCYNITQFNLEVYSVPEATVAPVNSVICSGQNAEFLITGTPEAMVQYTVDGGTVEEVYLDEDGEAVVAIPATADVTLTLSNVNITSNNTIACSEAVTDSAIVTIDAISVGSDLEDLSACTEDGMEAIFDLTQNDAAALANVSETSFTVSYFTSQDDADANTNAISNPEAFQNTTNPQEIFVRIQDASNTCFATDHSFELSVAASGTVYQAANISACIENGVNPSFDLTTAIPEILQTQGEELFDILFFESQTAAEANSNAITNTTNYTSDFTSECNTIYVRMQSATNPDCYTTGSFQICAYETTIGQLENLYGCDTDGDLSTEFDLTVNASNALNGEDASFYSLLYFTSYVNAAANVDHISNPESFTNTMNGQPIYIRMTNTETGCFDITAFVLQVYDLPEVNEAPSLQACETLTTPEFDLTQLEEIWIPAPNTNNFTFTYYTSETDAENETNAIDTPENYSSSGETLYVRIANTQYEGCYQIASFQTEIVSAFEVPVLTNYALCDDDTDGYTEFDLTTKIPEITGGDTNVAVQFYASETDLNAGTAISNPENYTNTTANQQTIYVSAAPVTSESGCEGLGSFTLMVNPLPVIAQDPIVLEACDIDADGYTIFDLTQANTTLINGQANAAVVYYASLADAEAQLNALSLAYTNTQTPTQTIYAKLINTVTGCASEIRTLELTLAEQVVASLPDPLEVCDTDNDGFAMFDFSGIADEVLPDDGGLYEVSVHETYADAENGVNAFSGMYENISANTQTMYVRVEDASTGCYDVTPLELIVHPTPVIIPNLDPLEICDDSVADGLAEFDLSVANEQVYGAQSNADFTISYHATEAAAQANEDALPTYYTNINAFQQTIFVRLENDITGCYTVRALDLIVHPNPVINPNYDNDLALCDDFGEAGDETLVFDLTLENEEVTDGIDGYMVMYYETQADAYNNTNQIIPDTAYTNIENPQTVFVRVEDAITGCTSFTTVTLRVLNNPTPLSEIDALEACDDDLDGDENNGQTVFDLTVDELAILNGETGVTPTYYESYDDAFAGTNPITNPTNYYNVSQYNQTIYVAVTNDATGCLTITEFELIVHPLPEVTDEPVYYLCELDNNDVEVIPVSDMNSFVLDGGDATDLEITYHTTEAYAEAGTNEIVGSITVNGTMTIYARVEDMATGCAQTVGYEIDIEQAPLAGQPEVYALCESLTADGYYNNDGVEIFDLTSLEETILDGQDPNGYTVSFYETYDNALAQISAIDEEDAVAYESAGQIVYAVVTNNDTGCTNGEPIEIELIVEPMPEVTLELKNGGIICIDATDNPVIGEDLGDGYSYEWNTGATTPTIEVTQAGEYYVTVTNTNSINQCSYTSNSITFEEASLPSVTPTVIQSEIFSGNNTIEVIANGAGSSAYEYQLDDNPAQDSGLFVNVEPGVHTVTITEVNGCGSLTIEVSVVDYMKYFTPNGDGVNDTWRIIGLESQENAQVFIFDRHGKLLKQLSSTSDGWDGTYNGTLLPANDYWFKVIYTDQQTGIQREFTNHFTLKF